MEGNNAYTRLRPEPTVAGRAPVMSETSMASRMNFGGGAGDCFADAIGYAGFRGFVWRPLFPTLRSLGLRILADGMRYAIARASLWGEGGRLRVPSK